VAGRLAAIAGEAAARFGGRATRRDTIHLTLAFLGDVPESRLA
jgi:2'-5' RNA ligase